MTQTDVDKVRKKLPRKKVFGEIAERLSIDDSTVRKCFNNYDDDNMLHIKIIETSMDIISEIETLEKKVKSLPMM